MLSQEPTTFTTAPRTDEPGTLVTLTIRLPKLGDAGVDEVRVTEALRAGAHNEAVLAGVAQAIAHADVELID